MKARSGQRAARAAPGLEWRNEQLEITARERAFWEIGPYQQYGFGTGSNGFGGFNPASSGLWDRANIAGYLDLEVNATDNWRIGGAVRREDFDGFGSTANFKLATHLRLSDGFALSGLFTVTDEIKQSLIDAGVAEAREFTSIRYFTNDFDTGTRGIDVVLDYGWETDLGNTDLLFSYNNTTTEVLDYREGSTIAGDDTIDNLERGAPETRYNVTLRHGFDQWDVVARYSYFGAWYDDHSAAEFGGYGLADVLVRYNFASGLAVTLGPKTRWTSIRPRPSTTATGASIRVTRRPATMARWSMPR